MNDRDDEPGRPEAAPLEREQVVERLCDHYAADHIEMKDFERRVDRAHRARTRKELRDVLAGLPALGEGTALTAGGSAGAGEGSSGAEGRSGSPRTAGVPARLDDEARAWTALGPGGRVPRVQTEVAIFSGRVRKGAWVPARRIRGLALMGGIELDFREALFPDGEISVTVTAVMGGVDILVPPGVRVETDGFAFLGGFDEDVDAANLAEPDAPVLRISGFAMMGGVDINCRYPGESRRQAKRRRKEAQRLQQEAHQRRLESGS